MKKAFLFIAGIILLTTITPNAKAQEWNVGLDINSSYIWWGVEVWYRSGISTHN